VADADQHEADRDQPQAVAQAQHERDRRKPERGEEWQPPGQWQERVHREAGDCDARELDEGLALNLELAQQQEHQHELHRDDAEVADGDSAARFGWVCGAQVGGGKSGHWLPCGATARISISSNRSSLDTSGRSRQ
jgi:hypothetical protein